MGISISSMMSEIASEFASQNLVSQIIDVFRSPSYCSPYNSDVGTVRCNMLSQSKGTYQWLAFFMIGFLICILILAKIFWRKSRSFVQQVTSVAQAQNRIVNIQMMEAGIATSGSKRNQVLDMAENSESAKRLNAARTHRDLTSGGIFGNSLPSVEADPRFNAWV